MVLFSLVSDVDVFHPETREILVSRGGRYSLEILAKLCLEYGIDNIPGILMLDTVHVS